MPRLCTCFVIFLTRTTCHPPTHLTDHVFPFHMHFVKRRPVSEIRQTARRRANITPAPPHSQQINPVSSAQSPELRRCVNPPCAPALSLASQRRWRACMQRHDLSGPREDQSQLELTCCGALRFELHCGRQTFSPCFHHCYHGSSIQVV